MHRIIRAASAVALALAIGLAGSANAATYATPDGYAPFSSDLNHPENWGEDCSKLDDVTGDTYTATRDYRLLVVKAGSGQFANTVFEAVKAGETVYADTNGNGVFDAADKDISHIIVCSGYEQEEPSSPPPTSGPTPTPTPTSSPEPSATPSPTASPAGTPEPSPTPSATPSSQPSTEPSPSITASPTTEPTSAPSTQPKPTLPPTDAESTTTPSGESDAILFAFIFVLGTIIIAIDNSQRRPRGR